MILSKGKKIEGQSLDRVVTLDQVVDKTRKQVFKAGTVNLVIVEARGEQEVSEVIQGVDAVDVELLLQLFGIAE